ncbi:MAG: diadenylate cyclase [Nanoarchaeota archaeon]|nr:diadenylate cyclase [Nanoarchaeota archaeon]
METEESIVGLSLETLNQLAHEIKADCIVTVSDQDDNADIWMDIEVLKEGEIEDDREDEGSYTIQVYREEKNPVEYLFKKTKTRQFDGIIAEIVSDLIKKSYVTQNMKLLIATDRTLAKKYNVALFAFDVNRVLYRIGKFNLAENMNSETVIESVIEVAQEIGAEGREGKQVGTLFVIGEPKELEHYTKQLIMNPFHGYDKDLLNIVHNDNLKETIKNFAQLDGAFTINNDGDLLSAGTYLDVDTSNIKPYQGWGTKHLAATAITKITSSVAILVSESGGAVKIFKNGKLVLRLR